MPVSTVHDEIVTPLNPGRLTRVAINNSVGQIEVHLSDEGNWQLRVRHCKDRDWRLLCTGSLEGGVEVPGPAVLEEAMSVGPLTVDSLGRQASVMGVEVPLSSREFNLLMILASHPTRVFSKAELVRYVWDGYASDATLRNAALRVRSKLRQAGASGFIVNFPDVGYMLCKGAPPSSAA